MTLIKKTDGYVLKEFLYSGGLTQFWVSVCEYIRFYMAVYGQEITVVSVLRRKQKQFAVSKEQNKVVCGLYDPV